MSSSSEDDNEPRPRKRGKLNKALHLKEIEKTARARGEEFVTHKGTLVDAKTTGPDCGCRKHCTEHFTIEEKQSILNIVYSGRPKNEKDTYLLGLIERHDVARHRPSTVDSKQITSSFKYYAMKGTCRTEVCRKAYIGLHSLSNSVVARLNKLAETGQPPNDMRGKHFNRANTLNADVIVKIDEHIASFPKKEAHYTGYPVIYLDASLTKKKMHQLFIEKHPELEGVVKYEYYLNHFNVNYGYRFGRPQVDVCSTCEELSTKINSPTLNDVAKRVAVAELMVHKRRTKKFYNKLKEIKEICGSRDDVMAITFDYMQNLPLPSMPVQEMFYLRKLWLYVFEIHDIGNNKAVFYTYTEGTAKKSPDEVCTFVANFLNTIPDNVKELHLFSDACGGQNRNHTLTRLLLALTMNDRFSIIHHYFPIRGHSYLPCDRDFSVVKRAVRRLDRIYVPHEYENLIRDAKKTDPKFEVKTVANKDIINFHDWWPQFFKKSTKDVEGRGEKFSISQYRHFVYSSHMKGCIKASQFIDGVTTTTFRLSKGKHDNMLLPEDKLYNGKVPVNPKKLQDISKIKQYVPNEHQSFYDDVLQLPTANSANSDDDE